MVAVFPAPNEARLAELGLIFGARTGHEDIAYGDLAGCRLAALSRVVMVELGLNEVSWGT